MNKKEILRTLEKYEAKSSHPQLPVVWDHAVGHRVYSDKKTYIDFTSGIFVTNSGHSAISRYLIHQITNGLIYNYTYPTEIKARLIRALIKLTPEYLNKVALATTGSEAVEIAVKLMRLAQGERKGIMAFKGAMHGKTWLGDLLTAKLPYGRKSFLTYPIDFPKDTDKFDEYKFDQLFVHAKACGEYNGIGGIIIESYRGWDAKFFPIEYIKDLIKWCRKHNILVCFDEIQSGFWRTGTLFAYEHYEVEPDLVCVGKGLGGGIPISAVLGKAEILDSADDLTATFSGNPLSCAGALGNLIQLEKLEKQETKAIVLKNKLEILKNRYDKVKDVNSKGLVGAIIFNDIETATKVCKLAKYRGVLVVYTTRESIKLGPPLNIPIGDLSKGLDIIEECIKEL